MNTPLINNEKMRENFGDDQELISEISRKTLDTLPSSLVKIKESIEKQDAKNLKISAHTLKGILANFCADELVSLAFQLEQIAKNGQLELSAEPFEKLTSLSKQFEEELEKLITRSAA